MQSTITKDTFQVALKWHEDWRNRTVNLIASENVMSLAVRNTINNDLLGRYADYPERDPSKRRYRGTRYIAEIEKSVTLLAQEALRAKFVEIRPISGHLAGVAVLMGLCKPGDVVLEVGRDGGSHREAGRLSVTSLAPLNVKYLPFDGAKFNIDVPKALDQIKKERPRAIILGTSSFLFPHPVRELVEAVKELPDTILIYDASHILGFTTSGAFQDPIAEGADIVFGSTHKTFPGPQGGIIFSNRNDLMEATCQALVPGLVTNHHPFRMPALGMTFLEMRTWGSAYAKQMVSNANALGDELLTNGIQTVNVDGCHTQTNTVLLCVESFGKGEELAVALEDCGVVVTSTHLPDYWGTEGIRIGTQEFTRMGGDESVAKSIGSLIADIIHRKVEPEKARSRATKIVSDLGPMRYTWETSI